MPDLSFARKGVRRRADRHAANEFVRPRPGFGAVRGGADGKIAVEAELQPARARPRGGAGELAIGQPLQEEGVFDTVLESRCDVIEGQLCAIAQIVGPYSPVFALPFLVDRLETGKAPQSLAALGDEAIVIGKQRFARFG